MVGLKRAEIFVKLEHACRNTPEVTEQMGMEREEEAYEQLTKCHEVLAMKSIPRFFHSASRPCDRNERNEDDNKACLARAIGQRLRREARAKMLMRRTQELMDEHALHHLLDLLKEYAKKADGTESETIRYSDFRKVLHRLLNDASSPQEYEEITCKFESFFDQESFCKFERSRNGCVAIVQFFSYVVRKVNIKQTRIQLSYYDTNGHGYLREKDMENFIFELIPTLPQLRSLQEEFYPFYVFTAVRKFFFFLDPHRSGRIFIADLLSSSILPELYELRQEAEVDEMSTNWFCVTSALKVYSTYLELDNDQNGMLCPSELSQYGGSMLTDVFVQRVFEEYQTYRDPIGGQEMDYKTYLNFVLAMENKATFQSMQYFFRLLDINHNGRLDSGIITYFFRFVSKSLEERQLDSGIRVEDVKDEIYDMVRPKNPNYITLADLYACKVGGTIISMLIDTQAFWQYDNREQLMLVHEEDEDPHYHG
eukprot:GEMP01021237.1.p1 GENE.GEMP01021237.1~~GEMP01021237.1.p1  ORF type:complete len:481 (+),score=103.52 GEMP01021237.1:142-1584(+)